MSEQEPTPFQAWLRDLLDRKYSGQPGTLGSRAGFSPMTPTNWLRGARPSQDALRKLETETGVAYEYLARLAGYTAPSTDGADLAAAVLVEIERDAEELIAEFARRVRATISAARERIDQGTQSPPPS